MKIHILFFVVVLFSGCNFFSNKETNKEKAEQLFNDITRLQMLLEPRITQLTQEGKIDAEYSFYKNWKKDFEKFQNQQTYMNYDLQLKNLEDLELRLRGIKEWVEKIQLRDSKE